MRVVFVAVAAALALSGCASLGAHGSTDPAPDALRVDPASIGWNAAALADVVSYVQSQKSTGLLIVQNGRVIAEHSWPLPADAATFRNNFTHGASAEGALIEDVASAQKSFIALLAAVAADKGLLDVSKPVSAYIPPSWSKATPAQESGITVLSLLEMNSGLKEDFSYEAEPGAKFFYNTPVYAKLKPILEAASKQSLATISAEWIIRPAGMKDTSWAKRPGAFADVGNPTGLATTPRDLAKMGELVLHRGKTASGQRVVSSAQIDAMLARTATNPSYGRLWWLNGGAYARNTGSNAPRIDGALVPAAPADLVAAQGAQDRKLYVVPSLNLVVVRMGQAAPDARGFNQEVWTRLMKAIPKK
jgi:CubicO group peptidase (beta-lactamase class C family)